VRITEGYTHEKRIVPIIAATQFLYMLLTQTSMTKEHAFLPNKKQKCILIVCVRYMKLCRTYILPHLFQKYSPNMCYGICAGYTIGERRKEKLAPMKELSPITEDVAPLKRVQKTGSF
jgi:hypothetical protein